MSMGGFLELQLPSGFEYYPDLVRLNTGRNALEYILRQKRYAKIYLPYYTCEVLLEPVRKLKIDVAFYHVNQDLEPVFNEEVESNACFLYTNYFGIKDKAVAGMANRFDRLIIDNSQAFFSEPLPGIDTFYSCRKFFGVPDGAYLSIKRRLPNKLAVDTSYQRMDHLTKSIDLGIESAYADSKNNNAVLENTEIKQMSRLTRRLLSAVKYDECASIRERNFNFLHKSLQEKNLLKFDFSTGTSPMVYPFLSDDKSLKTHLIQKKIFIATYWPNVYQWVKKDAYEHFLTSNLVALPIDHRYNLQDMFYMLNILKQLI